MNLIVYQTKDLLLQL